MRNRNNITCIVNADDFGRSTNINITILQSFKNGWISSATIMANMPGFNEACESINKYNLHDHVGLHFVLTQGTPLTNNIKHQCRFCDENGEFHRSRKHRLFRLATDEKEAVLEELRAQIQRCQKHGLRLTHVDSHHHIHEERGVLQVIIRLMREFGIPSIRIMGNTAERCSLHRRLYTMLYNSYLEYHGLNRSHYFGSIDQYMAFRESRSQRQVAGKVFEIMTHPVTNKSGVIVDAVSQRPLGHLINEAGLHRQSSCFPGTICDHNN